MKTTTRTGLTTEARATAVRTQIDNLRILTDAIATAIATGDTDLALAYEAEARGLRDALQIRKN